MNSRDQSDAIWIRQQSESATGKGIGSKSFSSGGFRGQSSFDFGSSNKTENPRFGFARSMSVNSEGASTVSSNSTNASPPYSPIDNNNRKGGTGSGIGSGGRFRTSSFSAGYGASLGNDNSLSSFDTSDPYLIHSPLSTSAPGNGPDSRLFRRSNSISVGALEHSHSNNYQRKASSALGGQPPLGPIDEYHKMATLGDAFKRSMDHLFGSPKVQAVGGRFGSGSGANASSMKEKKQMKDQVVSMLCESAIR